MLEGALVVVAGLGVSGRAAAEVLASRGARVVPVDDHADDVIGSAELLEGTVLDRADLVVASPGLAPHHPLLVAAREHERARVERGRARLARARRPRGRWRAGAVAGGHRAPTARPPPWACSSRSCAPPGENAVAVGNVGTPVVLAATDPTLDVLAVELSSFQLHHTSSMSAQAAAVLNVAPDHLDWHGSLDAYAADKGRIFERAQVACVYNLADRATEDLVREADVVDGCVAVGFTTGTPLVGQVGLVEDVLVDRGFARLRHTHAAELGTLDDLTQLAGPDGTVPPHVVANALAAAALALAHGVAPTAVRDGLRAYGPGEHRLAPRRGGRRRAVRGRLEGDQRPRGRGRARGVRATAASCGSRVVWPRGRSSTSSSPRGATACGPWCSSASTGHRCGTLSPDTHPTSPWSRSTPVRLAR